MEPGRGGGSPRGGAVAACVEAGVDAEVTLALGGKLDNVFSEPLEITGTVQFVAPEPAGDSRRRPVVVKVGTVLLVILNTRRSFTAPADFEEVGIDPLEHKIVVVKLGYLFQGLRDIAPRTIMALTPGFAYQVVENLTYEKIRRPISAVTVALMTIPNLIGLLFMRKEVKSLTREYWQQVKKS